jgi:hypothetical protein
MTDNDTRLVMEAYLRALIDGTEFERFFAPDIEPFPVAASPAR